MQGLESKQYNADLDKLISETKIISRNLLEQFRDAYTYDSATTYSWLVKKLTIIKNRLEREDKICLEDSELVLDKNNFLKWIELNFPFLKNDLQ